MASIKDVAKQANVSIATVSNALRGTKHVSKELQQRINEAVKELNYEISPFASGLKSRKTNTIGIIVTNMNRIFFPQVIKGIHDFFEKRDYSLTIYDTDDSLKKEKKYIEMLKKSWVDGIIVDSVVERGEREDYLEYLSDLGSKSKKIPVVSLERNFSDFNIDSVSSDNFTGAKIATKHLLELGCKNVAHITGPENSCITHDRVNGYICEVKKAGFKTITEKGDFSPLSGYQAMKELLLRGEAIDGVFAANDQMAIGTMKAIREHGLKIPEDIKVIGYDNTFVASIVHPSLSTINVPKFQLGTSAAELLMERMERPGRDIKNIDLPVQLITRQSTDPKGDNTWELFGW